jgi:hypothetical protein
MKTPQFDMRLVPKETSRRQKRWEKYIPFLGPVKFYGREVSRYLKGINKI